MNYEFGYVIAFQTKTNRGRDPGVLHPAEFLTFPELLRRFSIKGFRFWMELMARNVYTRQNDNYEIYFWILYVQNSEIRKYSLLILLLKMCWVRKLSKSEYKSNSISTYFKPDCKTNIVPIVCLAVWIGEFIWWQRYPKCANQNPNNGICRWQQNWLRRLNWKETECIYLWSRSKRTPAGFATISVLYQKVRTSWEAGVKERLHVKWGSNFP